MANLGLPSDLVGIINADLHYDPIRHMNDKRLDDNYDIIIKYSVDGGGGWLVWVGNRLVARFKAAYWKHWWQRILLGKYELFFFDGVSWVSQGSCSRKEAIQLACQYADLLRSSGLV